MQRKIKFRGKYLDDTSEWLYGNYVYIEDDVFQHKIVDKSRMLLDIDINTLGQYTGLKDRNMKEIYEGDIIFDSFYERKAKAVFLEGAFWLDYIDNFKEYETIHKRYQLLANYDNKSVLEVIGNIYDNPDLLEEGE